MMRRFGPLPQADSEVGHRGPWTVLRARMGHPALNRSPQPTQKKFWAKSETILSRVHPSARH